MTAVGFCAFMLVVIAILLYAGLDSIISGLKEIIKNQNKRG